MKALCLTVLLCACSTASDLPTGQRDAGYTPNIDTNVADGATPPCGRDEVSSTCKLTLTYDRWILADDQPEQCAPVMYQDEPIVLRPPACRPSPNACAWKGDHGAHYSDETGQGVESEVNVYRNQDTDELTLTVVFQGARCVYK